MICLFNETPGALIVVDSQYKDKVKTVADLKGMDESTIATQTTQNAEKLFGLALS